MGKDYLTFEEFKKKYEIAEKHVKQRVIKGYYKNVNYKDEDSILCKISHAFIDEFEMQKIFNADFTHEEHDTPVEIISIPIILIDQYIYHSFFIDQKIKINVQLKLNIIYIIQDGKFEESIDVMTEARNSRLKLIDENCNEKTIDEVEKTLKNYVNE